MPGKTRVSELAKRLQVPSKVLLAWLTDHGEYVKSASSTINQPLVRKVQLAFPAPDAADSDERSTYASPIRRGVHDDASEDFLSAPASKPKDIGEPDVDGSPTIQRRNINEIARGQVVNGVVCEIVDFGVFVDLGGIKGLVTRSQLSAIEPPDPYEVVRMGEQVTVKVLSVDRELERVRLSLRVTQERDLRRFATVHPVGQIVPGQVTSVVSFGAFVRVGSGVEGLVHLSELDDRQQGGAVRALKAGDEVLVMLIDIDLDLRRVGLSIAQAKGRMSDAISHLKHPDDDAEASSLVDPTLFLQPDARLFIDTNIFMDTDPKRSGGLKRLFERGNDAIARNGNAIVVPTKVIDELGRQSSMDMPSAPENRASAIRKASAALRFLDSASEVGLVRTDLGNASNPYADDLFLRIFEQFAGTYRMFLLTNDITLLLRVRILSYQMGKPLFAGVLTNDGVLQLESNKSLFQRGRRKHARLQARVEREAASTSDAAEIAALTLLLRDFEVAFGCEQLTAPRSGDSGGVARGTNPSVPAPFSRSATIKAADVALTSTSIPVSGDPVIWKSSAATGTLVLHTPLGTGGEGSVYEVDDTTVVKIFDKDHLTLHRKEKIELLVASGLEASGACIPAAVVFNLDGEFVGYTMPRASGRVLQRTIFNRRKFEKEFPTWTKVDLVDVCISFLEQVQYLHSANVLLGDISPKNIMVDDHKHVSIIDADSWQIEGYPCPVGTPMFTSPRMLGHAYSEMLRTTDDELFAVATMLFMIVMTGQFPYIRTGTDGDMVQLIQEGNFAFQYGTRNNKDQPDGDWKYMWSHVHKPVKGLFWNTFHRDGDRYSKRPSAAEWLSSFRAYRAYLKNSESNFDPMSNDVYPIRSKAFRPDTPILDCPTCRRSNAIAGIWRESEQSYFVPSLCTRCKESCRDCGLRSAVLRAGRCPACDYAYKYPACASCGNEFPRKTMSAGKCPDCHLIACKCCGANTKKSELLHGKCRKCRHWEEQIDNSRPCERCGRPFLTNGQVRFFVNKGLAVQKRHKEGTFGCSSY